MIIFQNVSKLFGNDSYALQEVSFEIPSGELVLLTGPSGSGKTTVMRLLTREYKLSEGEIFLEELAVHEVKKSKLHQLRRKIGVVFQDYLLLPELNVWENIALPLSIIGQKQAEIENRVTDLLKLVKLPDKAKLFPRQLSGGEAQRISIARALAIGPEVIFADEPTGNLDQETSLSIARLLKKIQELGTTVIFATHDSKVLEMLSGERVLHLENGHLTVDTGKKKKSAKPQKSAPGKEEKAEKKPDPDFKPDPDSKPDSKDKKETKKADEKIEKPEKNDKEEKEN